LADLRQVCTVIAAVQRGFGRSWTVFKKIIFGGHDAVTATTSVATEPLCMTLRYLPGKNSCSVYGLALDQGKCFCPERQQHGQ
jgi:hypothetical protein